jgi:hypothetical protein
LIAADALAAADLLGEAFPRFVSRTSFAATDRTMLSASIERSERREGRRLPTVHVELLDGTVAVNGCSEELAPREFAIVAALAQATGPLDEAWFVAAFWPTGGSSLGRFYAAMARLRAKLGAGAIVQTVQGYSLAPHATVDIVLIEAFVGRLPRTHPLSEEQANDLRRFDRELRDTAPFPKPENWFGSLHARIERLTRAVTTLLSQDALARTDRDAAPGSAPARCLVDLSRQVMAATLVEFSLPSPAAPCPS